jgi:hypothetical protein
MRVVRTMSVAHGIDAWRAVALALALLGVSAESCQNSTSTSTSGGTPITLTDRLSAISVPAGARQSTTASCQPDEVMLSGGYAVTTPAYQAALDQSTPLDRYFVFEDYPSSPTSWTASVLNRAAGAGPGSILLVAHVECTSGLSATPTIANAVGAIRDLVSAACSSGNLTGGGYQVTNIHTDKDVIAIVGSYGLIGGGASSWNVQTVYAQGSSADPTQTQVLSYAVCNSLTTGQGTAVPLSAPTGPADQATSGTGSASCATGQLLSGAGFELGTATDSLPVTHFFPDYSATPPQWDMTLYSLPAPSVEGQFSNAGGSATLVPICAATG